MTLRYAQGGFRSDRCRQICALGALLVPASFFMLLILHGWTFLAPTGTATPVWCCFPGRTACAGGEDPDRCMSDGAVAFSSTRELCTAACVSALPAPHADQVSP